MRNILTKIAAGLLAFSGIFPSVQGMNNLKNPENLENREAVVMRFFKNDFGGEDIHEIDVKKNPKIGEDHVIRIIKWDTTTICEEDIGDIKEEIEKLVIGEGINVIGSFTFYKNHELREVLILGNPQLGQFAFKHCHSLIKVIANSVKEINVGCFEGCVNLKEVSMFCVTHICLSAFKDCKNLEKLVCSQIIQYVCYDAFEGCEKLLNVPPERSKRSEPIECSECSKRLEPIRRSKLISSEPFGFVPNISFVDNRAFKECGKLSNVPCSGFQMPFESPIPYLGQRSETHPSNKD